ncbi:hypothetical protein [Kordiimonas aquimaris]|uniref:hypothetical protein n=1 Tax=Kordiimonas aquimaris TaxID=707591 RepID=UPI0021CE28D1|nr:hypothetical protein [Kordiimonas aquimaris]
MKKLRIKYALKTSVFVFLLFVSSFCGLSAKEFVFIHSPNDPDYYANLLKAALEAADGSHVLTDLPSEGGNPQNRTLRSMHSTDEVSYVTFTGHTPEREKDFHQIDIPLTRGLFGYRVFAILRENQPMFDNISALDDLISRTTMGSGSSWPDTDILENAGFRVLKGLHGNLWHMLARGRFNAYPRSVLEISAEVKRFADKLNADGLAPEQTIMLHYPFDVFFYVSKGDVEGAQILKQGLINLYKSGEFMELFNTNLLIREALQYVDKGDRKLYELPNPSLSDRVQKIDDVYWHKVNK